MIREQLASLDAVNLNLGSGTGVIMSIVLALIMFGIALGIDASTLKNIFIKPKSILTGLALQWFGLPLVTFILVMIFNPMLTPMVSLGMLLVASCPGGNISNFMSSFSKGNVELSVSMTAVSTVAAPFITPFNFWLWGNLYLKFASLRGTLTIPHLEIPFTEIFKTVFIILAIPIILGMLFAHYFPKATDKIKKPFSIFSIVVFIVMVLGMFIPNWKLFVGYIIFIFIIVLVHNATAFSLGFSGASLMKLPKRDRRSITIEVGIQNSGLGLTMLLNPAIFNPEIWNNPATGVMYGGMLFVTAWWGIWHIISGLTLASMFRRKEIVD
ncbi:MAG: bile acid:sodium symporter family protein [Bacteroidales bacterium]|nr:bile acid:sodium symporter family protein [Candidatus Cryptobacteroides choladohippi]